MEYKGEGGMRSNIIEVLYRAKNICYTLLRGVVLNKEKDRDSFFEHGFIGLLIEGILITLVLIMAILVLMLSGGSIEGEIKGVIEVLLLGG